MGQRQALVKGLGYYGATSVVAGTMIGTAVFLVSSDMLRDLGTPLMVLAVWAFAGVLSFFGALGYAELGAAIPEAGGEYLYLHRSYGPLMGFLYGWTQFLVAKAASIATIATGFLLYLAYFFPSLARVVWQLHLGRRVEFQLTGLQLGAAGMIAFVSVINVLGVRRSSAVQTFFTVCKLAVLAVLIVLGPTLGHGSWDHFALLLGPIRHGNLLAAFGTATISALWAYDGWNNLSMVAGEVENPHRNVPAALISGAVLVATVYLAVNIAYFYVLAPADVMTTHRIAADAARQFLGQAGGSFVAIGVLISTFATLNGSILSGSRIPYAQASDGLFPSFLARVHPQFRTPAAAIAAQAVIASIFALTGQYRSLYTKTIFSEWAFYALVTAGIFVLRRREPGMLRPYRTWGYPWVPAIFVLLAVAFLANTFVEQKSDVFWCAAIMSSGLPAYLLWNLWKRRVRSARRAGMET